MVCGGADPDSGGRAWQGTLLYCTVLFASGMSVRLLLSISPAHIRSHIHNVPNWCCYSYLARVRVVTASFSFQLIYLQTSQIDVDIMEGTDRVASYTVDLTQTMQPRAWGPAKRRAVSGLDGGKNHRVNLHLRVDEGGVPSVQSARCDSND